MLMLLLLICCSGFKKWEIFIRPFNLSKKGSFFMYVNKSRWDVEHMTAYSNNLMHNVHVFVYSFEYIIQFPKSNGFYECWWWRWWYTMLQPCPLRFECRFIIVISCRRTHKISWFDRRSCLPEFKLNTVCVCVALFFYISLFLVSSIYLNSMRFVRVTVWFNQF